jgi:hypothetical protein
MTAFRRPRSKKINLRVLDELCPLVGVKRTKGGNHEGLFQEIELLFDRDGALAGPGKRGSGLNIGQICPMLRPDPYFLTLSF